MGHHHSHPHGGLNEHSSLSGHLNCAFIIGIVLNLVFVVVEAVAGLLTSSLGLLTDAGHNLSDVAALALSLFAFRLSKIKPNARFTYGYSKTTILVALANAVILLIAVGSIGVEAAHRFFHPKPVQGNIITMVAGIGIIINTISALLFLKDKDTDLNIKGAYLHLVADALVSLGVVVAGIAITYTSWYWMDTLVSVIIMLVILISTWSLLSDSLRLSLDAVPLHINIEEVKENIKEVNGICEVHHIHIWALSTTVNALTAHLIIDESLSGNDEKMLKENVKQLLRRLHIQHATLETERGEGKCAEGEC